MEVPFRGEVRRPRACCKNGYRHRVLRSQSPFLQQAPSKMLCVCCASAVIWCAFAVRQLHLVCVTGIWFASEGICCASEGILVCVERVLGVRQGQLLCVQGVCCASEALGVRPGQVHRWTHAIHFCHGKTLIKRGASVQRQL